MKNEAASDGAAGHDIKPTNLRHVKRGTPPRQADRCG